MENLFPTLRQFSLLPESVLQALAQQLGDQPELGAQILDNLIQRGALTPFQAKLLRAGQAAELSLGDYVLLSPLGKGGMGQVFKARQRGTNRLVAVKLIHREMLGSPQALKRFLREIQAAAQLSHPNIVAAIDAHQDGAKPYYVMEYIEGQDLHHVVEHGGPLPLALACNYAQQTARGLQHAHEQGLVHRDIKPQNLLVTENRSQGSGDRGQESGDRGQGPGKGSIASPSLTPDPWPLTPHPRPLTPNVKILDMGLARFVMEDEDRRKTRLTRLESALGTPAYMAPEQALDAHRVDIRADLYALGCTLFYLLTGKTPFAGNSAGQLLFLHREAPPPDIRQHNPAVPGELADLVRRLLAKKPEDRFATPAELAQALEPFCAAPEQPATSDPAGPPTRSHARTWWPLGIGAGAVAVAVLFAAMFWPRSEAVPEADIILVKGEDPPAKKDPLPPPPVIPPKVEAKDLREQLPEPLNQGNDNTPVEPKIKDLPKVDPPEKKKGPPPTPVQLLPAPPLELVETANLGANTGAFVQPRFKTALVVRGLTLDLFSFPPFKKQDSWKVPHKDALYAPALHGPDGILYGLAAGNRKGPVGFSGGHTLVMLKLKDWLEGTGRPDDKWRPTNFLSRFAVSLVPAPDGQRLYSLEADPKDAKPRYLRVYTATGLIQKERWDAKAGLVAQTLNPKGDMLVVLGDDPQAGAQRSGQLYLFDPKTMTELWPNPMPVPFTPYEVAVGADHIFVSNTGSPAGLTGKLAVLGKDGKMIRLHDSLPPYLTIRLSTDDRYLFMNGWQGTKGLWAALPVRDLITETNLDPIHWLTASSRGDFTQLDGQALLTRSGALFRVRPAPAK